MIKTIYARNVNSALEDGLWHLKVSGVLTSSRNGPVLVAPGPVITAYQRPQERVLWSMLRDCNPFFHLFESMWMLAGRNDTATLAPLVPRMQEFSDDQQTLNGAYGYRWRKHFGYDQLKEIVLMLQKDPHTRRAVLSMWDPSQADVNESPLNGAPDLLNQGSKDLPCNTHIYFDGTRGQLDMTVCNRSNDVIWGAYGANSVHMSFLHEWVAASAGLRMGTYYQMSNNYHIYLDRPDVMRLITAEVETRRDTWQVLYKGERLYDGHPEHRPRALIPGDEAMSSMHFLDEMEVWCGNGGHLEKPLYSFTRDVLNPVMQAHLLYKNGDTKAALAGLDKAPPSDWRAAAQRWLQKRSQSAKHLNKAPV